MNYISTYVVAWVLVLKSVRLTALHLNHPPLVPTDTANALKLTDVSFDAGEYSRVRDWYQKRLQLTDDVPNLLEVLNQFRIPNDEFSLRRSTPVRKVAVCATGHIRSFVQRGVRESVIKNLLNNSQDIQMHYYFIGHTGADKTIRDGVQILNSPEAAREGLEAMATLVKLKEFNTHGGTCDDLTNRWRIDGREHNCTNHPNFLQAQWVDRCFQKVLEASKTEHYDLIIRSRPDVGIFEPLDFREISPSQVTAVGDVSKGGMDYFFVAPASLIQRYWQLVMSVYVGEELYKGGAPDHGIFPSTHVKNKTFSNDLGSMVHYLDSGYTLPAVLVRNSTTVHWAYQSPKQEWQALVASGYFS